MIDWQVYTPYGKQILTKGTNREAAFSVGIPHAAAHVWIWKVENNQTYLLFQKTAPKVDYKAGLLDISAAGHVDIGEDEISAAIRETREELGIELSNEDFYFAGVEHYQRKTKDSHKDEFRFVYTVQFDENMIFTFADGEVDGVEWIAANNVEEIISRDDFNTRFVQHTAHYFNIVFSGIAGHFLLTNPSVNDT